MDKYKDQDLTEIEIELLEIEITENKQYIKIFEDCTTSLYKKTIKELREKIIQLTKEIEEIKLTK